MELNGISKICGKGQKYIKGISLRQYKDTWPTKGAYRKGIYYSPYSGLMFANVTDRSNWPLENSIGPGPNSQVGFVSFSNNISQSSYSTTTTKGDNNLSYFTTNVSITYNSVEPGTLGELMKLIDKDLQMIMYTSSASGPNTSINLIGDGNPVRVESFNVNYTDEYGNSNVTISFKVDDDHYPWELVPTGRIPSDAVDI